LQLPLMTEGFYLIRLGTLVPPLCFHPSSRVPMQVYVCVRECVCNARNLSRSGRPHRTSPLPCWTDSHCVWVLLRGATDNAHERATSAGRDARTRFICIIILVAVEEALLLSAAAARDINAFLKRFDKVTGGSWMNYSRLFFNRFFHATVECVNINIDKNS